MNIFYIKKNAFNFLILEIFKKNCGKNIVEKKSTKIGALYVDICALYRNDEPSVIKTAEKKTVAISIEKRQEENALFSQNQWTEAVKKNNEFMF